MHELSAVRSLRYRYIIGLSVIALLVTSSFVTMRLIIAKQESYSHLIFVAGQQNGLSNRIAHFAGQMAMADNDDEFSIARSQLGRALNAMRKAHTMLLTGDEASGLPQVMTPLLRIIFYDEQVGLDLAVRRFLKHAQAVYETEYGELTFHTSAYVYLVNYGPHVLEPMLASVVEEFEAFSRGEIKRIEQLEMMLWLAALATLVLEAYFIYRPLERRVRTTVLQLENQNEELARTIREIELTRQDMERQKDIAEQANRSKSEFLSNMSHELRTPLNAIIGFSASLQAGVYGPLNNARQEECLRDISASGGHLLDLINDVLDLSAAEAEQLKLNETAVPLRDLVESSLRLVDTDARQRNVSLVADIAVGLPDLFCDDRRIKQVLLNLLSNAVKFTPAHGRVTVSAYQDKEGRLQLAVRDTGIGMDTDEIDIALSRFGQVGNPMSRNHQGTGLGLPLAVSLAKLHGAAFLIDSRRGRGTDIRLIFPKERLAARKIAPVALLRKPELTAAG